MKTTTKTLITLAAMAASLTAIAAPMANAEIRPIYMRAPTTVQTTVQVDYQNRMDRRANHMDMHANAALDARIGNLQDRIDTGKRTHALTRSEAMRLTGKLNGISALKTSFARSGGGLNGSEIATLTTKLDNLSAMVRIAKS